MKITLYTVTDSPFCKQAKDYLTGKGISFEEKNLDTNKELVQEMLSVSGNFRGVPVTKVEKDGGESVVLKGFTSEEFDKTFSAQAGSGSSPTPPGPTPPPADLPSISIPEPTIPPALTPVSEPPAVPEPTAPPTPEGPVNPPAPATSSMPSSMPSTPTLTSTPPAPATATVNDPLSSILNNLQSKAAEPSAPAPQEPKTEPAAPAQSPTVPPFEQK